MTGFDITLFQTWLRFMLVCLTKCTLRFTELVRVFGKLFSFSKILDSFFKNCEPGGASPPETVKRVVYNAAGGVKSNSPIVSKVIHSWHGVSETIGVFRPLDGLGVGVDGSSRAWTNHCRSWEVFCG